MGFTSSLGALSSALARLTLGQAPVAPVWHRQFTAQLGQQTSQLSAIALGLKRGIQPAPSGPYAYVSGAVPAGVHNFVS